jgi:hypothetical protein
MANTFSPLKGDNDVLLLNKDTFTVSRLKELIEKLIKTRLSTTHEGRFLVITSEFCTLPVGGETQIVLNNIQWCTTPIDCQILKISSQGWQKGKIRIQVETKILASSKANEIDICIEFCPDEPTEPESPLDDLRQLSEYKQQP